MSFIFNIQDFQIWLTVRRCPFYKNSSMNTRQHTLLNFQPTHLNLILSCFGEKWLNFSTFCSEKKIQCTLQSGKNIISAAKQQCWQWKSVFPCQKNSHWIPIRPKKWYSVCLMASKMNQDSACYEFVPSSSLLKAAKSATNDYNKSLNC